MFWLWTSHSQEVSHLGWAKTIQQRHEKEAGRVWETYSARQSKTHHIISPRCSNEERYDEQTQTNQVMSVYHMYWWETCSFRRIVFDAFMFLFQQNLWSIPMESLKFASCMNICNVSWRSDLFTTSLIVVSSSFVSKDGCFSRLFFC